MAVESLNNNQTINGNQKRGRGGARIGAGRKPGALSAETKKVAAARASLRELASAHVPDAVATLAHIARNSQSDQAKVAAIKELFDRAYGKAPQALTGEDGEGPVKHIVEVVWASGSSGVAS